MRERESGMQDLTKDEQKHVRAALHFLRLRFGTWTPLSKVLRFNDGTVANVAKGRTVSPTMAFRVARFASVSIEDLLAGKYPAPGTCPHCGHHKEEA